MSRSFEDKKFAELVADVVVEHPDRVIALADNFGVPPYSVNRWGSGTAVPLPAVRNLVVKYIRNKWGDVSRRK